MMNGWFGVMVGGDGWFSVLVSGDGWFSVLVGGDGWFIVLVGGDGCSSVFMLTEVELCVPTVTSISSSASFLQG